MGGCGEKSLGGGFSRTSMIRWLSGSRYLALSEAWFDHSQA